MALSPGCSDRDGPRPASAPAGLAPARTLTVFAAASLTDAFTELGHRFEALNPGSTIRFSFGASSSLARQVTNGAPADVLATADESSFDLADAAGTVGSRQAMASNSLVIVVRKGNPKAINGLSDLGRDGQVVVLCAVEVPCGRYASQVLDRAGETLRPASLEADVKAVVSKVSLGEADAGIAYVTDVMYAGGRGVQGVTIPAESNVVARYVIGALRAAGPARRPTADAFVAYVTSPEGLRTLETFGFAPP